MRKNLYLFLFACLFSLIALTGCSNKKNSTTDEEPKAQVAVPSFDADSAFASVVTQCSFGPRVMNSEAHESCGNYIVKAFEKYGLKVTRQEAVFVRYDGLQMKGYNIIAQTDTQATQRLMIATHWDSRPWADNDPDETRRKEPVLAANDGASGVAVMIELARVFQQGGKLPVGVDFVCFDAEDAGVPAWETAVPDREQFWCLGSQYWAAHPHTDNIKMGILLDMVGGQGARFYREGYSQKYAAGVLDMMWQSARDASYGSFFKNESGGYITDDHLPVNTIAKIPMIDVIPYYPDAAGSSFGPTWHTVSDIPDNIDRATLKAVGQTLLQLIYNW